MIQSLKLCAGAGMARLGLQHSPQAGCWPVLTNSLMPFAFELLRRLPEQTQIAVGSSSSGDARSPRNRRVSQSKDPRVGGGQMPPWEEEATRWRRRR